MKSDYVLVDEVKKLVENVSTKLLPTLQAVDPLITGVHFEHGHLAEVVETLRQKNAVEEERYKKYPLIALIHDFPENVTGAPGVQSEPELRLIIVNSTEPTYKAKQRLELNFKPILYPIYKELLEQFRKSPVFMGYNVPPHKKTDRLYWGREKLIGTAANIFEDWVDCIELQNLKTKLKLKLC